MLSLAFTISGTALLPANTVHSSSSAELPVYLDLLKQLDFTMQAHHVSLQRTDSNGHFLETTLQDADGVREFAPCGRLSAYLRRTGRTSTSS